MSNQFEVIAIARNDIGKGASRRLRRLQDQVPGIIYGGGQAATSISVEHNKLIKALENEAFYSHILTVVVDGKAEKAVLKDLQRHPSKPRILHFDLQRINASEKLHMRVPLHFVGADVAPGVKQAGGIVSHLINDVEVRCLPADLPEFIGVDIAHLNVDQPLHLSELKLPKGVELVELIHGHDLSVASIHLPRGTSAEEAAAE